MISAVKKNPSHALLPWNRRIRQHSGMITEYMSPIQMKSSVSGSARASNHSLIGYNQETRDREFSVPMGDEMPLLDHFHPPLSVARLGKLCTHAGPVPWLMR